MFSYLIKKCQIILQGKQLLYDRFWAPFKHCQCQYISLLENCKQNLKLEKKYGLTDIKMCVTISLYV